MASKRLAMDRKVFHELASHLFPLILSLWNHSISNVYRLIDIPNVPGNWDVIGNHSASAGFKYMEQIGVSRCLNVPPSFSDCVPVTDSLAYLDKANLSLKVGEPNSQISVPILKCPLSAPPLY